MPPTATPTTSPRDRSPDTDDSNTFTALREANIDYTVPEKDLKQWLRSPESTPYPSISEALLRLLADKRLREPVAIDVIVYNYENAPRGSSPRRVEDVDLDLLRAAVLEGFNTRYNASAASLDDVLEQRPA